MHKRNPFFHCFLLWSGMNKKELQREIISAISMANKKSSFPPTIVQRLAIRWREAKNAKKSEKQQYNDNRRSSYSILVISNFFQKNRWQCQLKMQKKNKCTCTSFASHLSFPIFHVCNQRANRLKNRTHYWLMWDGVKMSHHWSTTENMHSFFSLYFGVSTRIQQWRMTLAMNEHNFIWLL